MRETLHKGEILIVGFIDPGWIPLFINAAIKVLVAGAALPHGIGMARMAGNHGVLKLPET